MPADVQVLWTPDTDPNVTKQTVAYVKNGTAVGSVDVPVGTSMSNFLSLTPAPAPLAIGDVITGTITGSDSFGQTGPAVPFPAVTIIGTPPPPTGVTGVTSKQVGFP